MKFSSFVIAAAGFFLSSVLLANAQLDLEDEGDDVYVPQFTVSTSFVDNPLLPVTIFNSKETHVEITLRNDESQDCIVQVAGGALFQIGDDVAIDNVNILWLS